VSEGLRLAISGPGGTVLFAPVADSTVVNNAP
jgi:hypothetical protein